MQCIESRKEAARLIPLLTPRTLARLASWDIRTMHETVKTIQVAREMKKKKKTHSKKLQYRSASGCSMWHFLKLVARRFLRVLRFPPLLHRFSGSVNKIKLK